MSVVLRDVRYAVRSLRKTPALAVVAILALALGIGLTTTMFSIIYGALMKGLPFEGAERIALVWGANPARGFKQMSPSIQDYQDFAAQQRSFEQLGAYYSGTVNISGTERAERFAGSWTTANVIALTGVHAMLGRTIRAGEDRPGGERVVVLGYSIWKNRYGGDPRVIGQTIRANGVPFTIVGVMPEGFSFPENTAVWMPLQMDPLVGKRGDGQHVDVIGKLRPGVSLDAASVEMAGIAKRLAATYKESNEGQTASVRTFIDSQIGPEPQRLLYTMLGAVFVVLLIACANVANLLLDRAAHRSREVGIRTALGASRATVVRQFLAEALVLSMGAAAIGVLAAKGGIVAFNRAIADTDPPSWIDIRLHPPVLLFALGVAFVTSVVAGFLPAIQASRTDINEILKDESRGASSMRIGRMSRVLVMFEIALSVGLLVAAGLMTKSVARLRTMDPGFRTDHVFTARAGFPATYTDTVKQRQFWETLQQRLAGLPGVESAAVGSGLPGVNMSGGAFAIEGKTYASDRELASARTQTVQPSFWTVFGVKPRSGRLFTSADRLGALPVALVNESFVTKYMPGQDPVGRRIRRGRPQGADQAPWVTIVGVVPALYSGETDDPCGPAVYTPLAQEHSNFASIAVRTRGDPMAITQPVRDAVASLDADIPLYWVYSMDEALARPLWFIRVFGTMFMIFGFIALFLAGIGLYAVMAFSVSRRTREVGIRMALGAQAGHVVQLVLRQGVVQLGVGMAVGLALAIGVGKLVGMLLYDVQPRDPVVFAGVIGVLAAAGLLACYVPARRATAVDPLIAMRSE